MKVGMQNIQKPFSEYPSDARIKCFISPVECSSEWCPPVNPKRRYSVNPASCNSARSKWFPKWRRLQYRRWATVTVPPPSNFRIYSRITVITVTYEWSCITMIVYYLTFNLFFLLTAEFFIWISRVPPTRATRQKILSNHWLGFNGIFICLLEPTFCGVQIRIFWGNGNASCPRSVSRYYAIIFIGYEF